MLDIAREIKTRPYSKTVKQRVFKSESKILRTLRKIKINNQEEKNEKLDKSERQIKKTPVNPEVNSTIKYTRTLYSFSVLPIIVIQDKYYKSIIDYLKSEELSKIHKKSYTTKRTEIYKKEYKILPLTKLLRPLSSLGDFPVPKCKENNGNDIESFLACVIQYYIVYGENEKNKIVSQIKNDNVYFRENFDIKIEEWAIELFNALKCFIRIKLEKYPYIYQKKGTKYPTLFISSAKKNGL